LAAAHSTLHVPHQGTGKVHDLVGNAAMQHQLAEKMKNGWPEREHIHAETIICMPWPTQALHRKRRQAGQANG